MSELTEILTRVLATTKRAWEYAQKSEPTDPLLCMELAAAQMELEDILARGVAESFGAGTSAVKEKIQAFLSGLDSGDKFRLKDAAKEALDQYVPDLPGPDPITRPLAKDGLERAIDDFCT